MTPATCDVHMGYRANHACEGLQSVRIALLPAATRECELGMLAQTAIGTRCSGQHAAPAVQAARTNEAAPTRVKAGTRKEPAAAVLRRPVTSLTTTDRLRKSHPMKASMAWVNETRPAKVSSARWVCGGG